METYKAPLREIEFVLHDVLNVSQLTKLPGYADAGRDTFNGVIEEAAKLIEEKIAPLNARGDAQGCRWDNGEVQLPDGYAEAYRLYWQAGWVGLSASAKFGGQGLPYTLSKVVEEMLCSANVGFALYPGLTSSCFEAIDASGSEEQKKTWLPKLGSGEWTGTMCMTEPQAGSDLAAVKTKAAPNGDGSFSIEGSKIFITSGEHSMADNIVHFVLARLPDAPAGIKGLSTFVVPKFLLKPDGSLGERNRARCVSIEHKMGMHGSCTCTMLFEGARGWMVGAPNTGIQNMFVMMNLARIMVGLQGLGLCELATQNAIRYARDRRQGKGAIVEHADVRRMLLTMKALTEANRVMAYETAINIDLAAHHPDAAARETAQDWVDLTTPLVKAFITDSAVDLGSLVIQVYGGHGYIKEHGVEQIARDAKILCLYEGTNGIQAMDLVRRKLMLHNGRLPGRFFERVRKECGGDRTLMKAVDELEATTKWLQQSFKTSPDAAGMGAVDFLKAFSLTMLGYNWVRMSRAAAPSPESGFRAAKLATAEFFATRLLPEVHMRCAAVRAPAESAMQLDAANF